MYFLMSSRKEHFQLELAEERKQLDAAKERHQNDVNAAADAKRRRGSYQMPRSNVPCRSRV